MQPDSSIRRQVYLLSIEDLTDQTIWEFCSDEEGIEGQDEATVKPSDESQVPGYSPGAYVVAADVKFADGTLALGYLYSGPPDDFGCIQPNVVAQAGQVNFWLGSLEYIEDVEKTIAKSLQVLGKSPEQVFPVSFQSRVRINNEFQKIVVNGFMAMDRNRTVKTLG
jgi:hypothetical protein